MIFHLLSPRPPWRPQDLLSLLTCPPLCTNTQMSIYGKVLIFFLYKDVFDVDHF